ncbi:MAG: hypothetical protein JMDDDDMK_05265 [Acidobacteria bacterium]|nr:hypothetical protein [Acidobacteriota bacterium]
MKSEAQTETEAELPLIAARAGDLAEDKAKSLCKCVSFIIFSCQFITSLQPETYNPRLMGFSFAGSINRWLSGKIYSRQIVGRRFWFISEDHN